uniref:ATP synthase subunit a n=1 Tax=Beta vulgaris subsp. vulgaris TaxID=3555 RepID=Q34008_BETVV|nr:Fo ATPase subunit 6 [Beta vulgaris subsp. vulgaris]
MGTLMLCGLLTLFTLLQAMVHRKEEGVGKFLLPAAFLISDLVLLWLHSGAIQNPLGKAALTGAAVLILFSQASASPQGSGSLQMGRYLMCIPPILYIIGGATDWPIRKRTHLFYSYPLASLSFLGCYFGGRKRAEGSAPAPICDLLRFGVASYGPDVWVKEWLAAFSLTIGAVFLFEKVGYRKDTLPETSRTWEPWFCFFAVLSFGVALSFFHASPALGVGTESEAFHDAINPAAGRIPSPLEQFSILPLIPMKIGNLYFSFTNPSLFMLLTLSLVLLLLHFVTKKGGGNSVPNVWQSLVELIYDFVLNLVNEQIGGLSGNVKQKFFPCILVTFTFLLFRNLQGMIPYSFTVTSHFLITLGLSFSIFIGITIVGFQRNGLHFLSFSLPAGVPLPLAPFLVLLELIPHCFRALSSGIRLFANMMAGHSSVKILSGFAWTMLCMNDLLYFIGDLGPLFIVLALTGLELGVAILQAHVFTILICIYLNDATNLHQNSFFFLLEFL